MGNAIYALLLLIGVFVGMCLDDLLRGLFRGVRGLGWWLNLIEMVFALTIAVLIIAGVLPTERLRR